jgi:hypothetical protein
MPHTKRLLVAALAFTTLSLSPLESFAGPLSTAVQAVPPDWLTRIGPRHPTSGRSCRKALLTGLAIGAGAGAAYGLFVKATGVEEGGKIAVATTLMGGGIGSLFGLRACQ